MPLSFRFDWLKLRRASHGGAALPLQWSRRAAARSAVSGRATADTLIEILSHERNNTRTAVFLPNFTLANRRSEDKSRWRVSLFVAKACESERDGDQKQGSQQKAKIETLRDFFRCEHKQTHMECRDATTQLGFTDF